LSNKIKLDKDKRKQMIASIRTFFENERDEEIGELASSAILDFFLEELAPEIYNQGVFDSYRYISDRAEDLLGLQK
jgi:uncharacterized protein (DUF2164 family)